MSHTLTAPGGTRYTLDAQGEVLHIEFPEKAAWLVSDAGIVAETVAEGGGRQPTRRLHPRQPRRIVRIFCAMTGSAAKPKSTRSS